MASYEAPQHCDGAYVPARANSRAHLAKMQDFQGEGSDRLDSFFDHMGELADFYRWDERETSRAHLHGTALAYVKRVPFQPRSWEELKALLLKRFQPRDLTATYKAQFRSRRRHHNEDVHTYVEALQRPCRYGLAVYGCTSQGRARSRPIPDGNGEP